MYIYVSFSLREDAQKNVIFLVVGPIVGGGGFIPMNQNKKKKLPGPHEPLSSGGGATLVVRPHIFFMCVFPYCLNIYLFFYIC